MSAPQTRVASEIHFYLLAGVVFLAFLCVGLPLASVPVYVTAQLGLGNVWAGLGVGIAFAATILSRGWVGTLSDRRGGKISMQLGLALYAAGALIILAGTLLTAKPLLAYGVLLAGRLLVGTGESFVTVCAVTWGVGLVGTARSSRVFALIGAAIYGGLAVGGPIGLALLDRFGFSATMAVSAALPCVGLLITCRMPAVEPHPHAERPSFISVIGRIWWHGSLVLLQGIGFAAIGAFFALYFRDQNWSHAGLGLTAFGAGFVMTRIFFGHTPDRYGGLPVAIASLFVETVGQVLIWTAPHPSFALAGAFLTGFGCSMVFPAIGREVVRLVEPHLRGTALGGFAAFQDLAYGLTGPIAGLVADRAGYGSVFLIGAVAAAFGFVVANYLYRRQKRAAA